jgi:hypothetical protein
MLSLVLRWRFCTLRFSTKNFAFSSVIHLCVRYHLDYSFPPVAPCGAYGLRSEVSWSGGVHSVVGDQSTDCASSTHFDMTARAI